MNRLDIQQAEKILDKLKGSKADPLLKQLAGNFRQLGLISTLRWLYRKSDQDGQRLAQLIEGAISVPLAAFEGLSDTREHFKAAQRAGPLIEALHITHRARSKR